MNFICVYQVWSKLIEKCPSKIQDGRHESFFFVISTSVRGDFPRIIEIALYFFILFIYYIFSNADFFSILNVFQSYLNLRYPIENLFIVSSRIRIQNLTIIIGRWHSNQLSHSALLIIEISITVVFDYKKWSLLYNSLLNTSLLYNRLLNNSVLLNCLLHVQAVPIKMTTFVFSIITKWPVVRHKWFEYQTKPQYLHFNALKPGRLRLTNPSTLARGAFEPKI